VQTVKLSFVKFSTISNELKQASTWASSPRGTIGCVQNDFWAYGMFSTNHARILHRHQHYLQMDQNDIPHDPRHLGVPSGAFKNDFWCCGTFGTNRAPILHQDYHYLRMDWIKHPLEPRHLGVPSGASKKISEPTVCLAQTYKYLAPTPTLSPNGPTWDSTWPTSPWSSIGCFQNDFWAFGTFGANHEPFLHQD
jgi:hypothetical protein